MQLLYETLDKLIEALAAFTIRQSFSFVDRQTDKLKDQSQKQLHYLGRKNNMAGCHRPNYILGYLKYML